jgi:hypothetical protein
VSTETNPTKERKRARPAIAAGILSALLLALTVASAQAATLVYVKHGRAYVANVDGSRAHAVTPKSQWWAWPSESDGGKIAVAGGAERVNPGGATESSGSSEIYAFDQHGRSLLSQPVHTPGSVSSPGNPTYVDHFRISPDGSTVAYDVLGCCGFSGETTFTSPLRAGASWSPFQDDYIAPEWVNGTSVVHTANALGLTHNGATFGSQAEYAIFDAANSSHNLGWSGDAAIPDGWGYTATFTRDTRKVALFLNDAADRGGTPQNVRIHLETINPDLSETDGCTITLPPGQFAQPHSLSQASVSFSPDGNVIAWGQADGIHEATSDCGSQRLVVPAGAMPSFGAAGLTRGSSKPRITKVKVSGRAVTVKFRGSGSFRCRLDHKRWRRCKSPARYRHLRRGKHVFRVRAGKAVTTKRFRVR